MNMLLTYIVRLWGRLSKSTEQHLKHGMLAIFLRVLLKYIQFLSPLYICKLYTSVQSLSRIWLFATPWTAAHQFSLSITNSQSLLKLMSNELVIPSTISSSVVLFSPCSMFPSIRVFSNESVLRIRWPMYLNFSYSISPSNEYSGLISFRIN